MEHRVQLQSRRIQQLEGEVVGLRTALGIVLDECIRRHSVEPPGSGSSANRTNESSPTLIETGEHTQLTVSTQPFTPVSAANDTGGWRVVPSKRDDVFAELPGVDQVHSQSWAAFSDKHNGDMLNFESSLDASPEEEDLISFEIIERPFTLREHNHLLGEACYVEDMTEDERAQHFIQKAHNSSWQRHTSQEYIEYYEQIIRPAHLKAQHEKRRTLENEIEAQDRVKVERIHAAGNATSPKDLPRVSKAFGIHESGGVRSSRQAPSRFNDFTIFIFNIPASLTLAEVVGCAENLPMISATLVKTAGMKTMPPIDTNAAYIVFPCEETARNFLHETGTNPLYFWTPNHEAPVKAQFVYNRLSVHPRLAVSLGNMTTLLRDEHDDESDEELLDSASDIQQDEFERGNSRNTTGTWRDGYEHCLIRMAQLEIQEGIKLGKR